MPTKSSMRAPFLPVKKYGRGQMSWGAEVFGGRTGGRSFLVIWSKAGTCTADWGHLICSESEHRETNVQTQPD